MSDATEVEFFVVQGVEGPCLVLADRRIAGPKPWGGGRVIFTFKAEHRRLLDALAASCRSASETERDRLRPAHDAEIREQARREQLEADCDAAAGFRMGDRYASDAIRTAYAKAHPEREKKEAERAE